jgi:hypothetical protein
MIGARLLGSALIFSSAALRGERVSSLFPRLIELHFLQCL